MRNILEFSGLSVCLGEFLSFYVPVRKEKGAGLWFALGISTQADTMRNEPHLFSVVIRFLVGVTSLHTPNHSLNWFGIVNGGVILIYTVNIHK